MCVCAGLSIKCWYDQVRQRVSVITTTLLTSSYYRMHVANQSVAGINVMLRCM